MKYNILFVDDDVNILSGLKRLFHSPESEFIMTFCESGAAALEILSKDIFHAVVTDYKMPAMTGIELLTKVKEKYPAIVRILLTGQTEGEIFEDSKEVVHAYLSKPCSSQDITAVLREKIIIPGAQL